MRWYLDIVLSISSHFSHMVSPSVSESERLSPAAWMKDGLRGRLFNGSWKYLRRSGAIARKAQCCPGQGFEGSANLRYIRISRLLQHGTLSKRSCCCWSIEIAADDAHRRFSAARGGKIIRETFAISRPPSRPGRALSRPDARIRRRALRAFRLAAKVHGREPVSVLPPALPFRCFQLRARSFSKTNFSPWPRSPSFLKSMRTLAACSGLLPDGEGPRQQVARAPLRQFLADAASVQFYGTLGILLLNRHSARIAPQNAQDERCQLQICRLSTMLK
jgi:hypothetical protein